MTNYFIQLSQGNKRFCGYQSYTIREMQENRANFANSFGYIKTHDGKYMFFVTDGNGAPGEYLKQCQTEDDAQIECDKLIVANYLEYHCKSPRNIVKYEMSILEQHKDILHEFAKYILSNSFADPNDSVCYVGYTAEKLAKEYDLSPADAFLSLTGFVKYPETTKANLNRGLPFDFRQKI